MGLTMLQAERVLEYPLSKLYTRKYAPLKFRKFLDINHEVPAGAEMFSGYLMEEVGEAEITRDYSDDSPSVDAKTTKFSRFVVPIRDKFIYSMQELENAAMPGGRPIDSIKAAVAFNAIERKHNKTALLGWTPIGWEGLFNLTDASLGTGNAPVPINPATVGNPLNGSWGAATADEMVADIQTLQTSIIEGTLENYEGTYLVLPLKRYAQTRTKRLGDASNMTVFQYIQANFPGLTIDTSLGLTGAGVGGTDRMVLFQKDPEVVEYVIPMEFQSLSPQLLAHLWTVHCHSRTGGLNVHIPKAIAYGDGI